MTLPVPRRLRRRSAGLAAAATTALVACTLIAASPAAAHAEEKAAPHVVVMTPELHDRIQTRVEEFRQANDIAGMSAAVVTPDPEGKGAVITTFASGVSDKETKAPVDASTQFELGSETKAFTADLLAYLVADGRVSLDDPVQEFAPEGTVVPEWVDAETGQHTRITLRDLATHQAGLTDLPPNFDAACDPTPTPTPTPTPPPTESPAPTATPTPTPTPAPTDCNPHSRYTQSMLWAAFSEPCVGEMLCPLTKPGTAWLYSNWGFGLLGTILANVVERMPEKERPAYQPALDGAFVGALGMTSTQLEYPDNPRMATPYTAEGGKAEHWDNWNALAGGGGLISDATDMGTWVAAHLGFTPADAPLGVQTMARTLDPVSDIRTYCSAPGVCEDAHFQMGLAWQLYAGRPDGVTVPYAFKDGGTAGSSTDTALAPSLRMGVTTLYNRQRPADEQDLQLAVSLLALLVTDAETPHHDTLADTGSDLLAPGVAAAALVALGAALVTARRGRTRSRVVRARG